MRTFHADTIKSSKPTLRALLFFILIVSFFIAYFPVWENLAHAWLTSDENSHGLLIIPICIYSIYTKKDELAGLKNTPSMWGLVFSFLALSLYIFAVFSGISTLASLTIIPFLAGVIIYLFSFSMVRGLAFPLLLLLFMIPVPSQIYSSLTVPLQLIVSEFSVMIAFLFGIPIYREGNVISLPEQTLEVVAACSGIRSLTSLLTLSFIVGYFTIKSNLLRFILFFSAIPIAIIVNIIRVLLIIAASYFFDFDLTKDTMHTLLGIGTFIAALLIVFAEKGALEIWDK